MRVCVLKAGGWMCAGKAGVMTLPGRGSRGRELKSTPAREAPRRGAGGKRSVDMLTCER